MDKAHGRRVIDAHVHVWDINAPWMTWIDDRPPHWDVVRRTFEWADLRAELDAAQVQDLILVQASPDPAETRAFLRLAGSEPSILGVVGWASLRSAQAIAHDLESFTGIGGDKLVGIRNNHNWAPDDDVLATPAVLDACRLLAERKLPLDLHFPDYRTLSLAGVVAEAVPDNHYIIDHLGKPDIANAEAFKPWAEAMTALSDLPHIYVKFSGWGTFLGRALADDVRRHVDFVLEKFGAERIMFGSNWPVALVAADYRQTYDASLEAIGHLSQDDVDQILSGTALRCYRIADAGR